MSLEQRIYDAFGPDVRDRDIAAALWHFTPEELEAIIEEADCSKFLSALQAADQEFGPGWRIEDLHQSAMSMRTGVIRLNYAALFDALLEALHSERLPGLRVLQSESGRGWDVAEVLVQPGPDSTIAFEPVPGSSRPLVSSGNIYYAEELALLQTEHLIPAAPVLIPARREWLVTALAMLPARNRDYVSRHPKLLTAYQQIKILEGLL